MHIRYLLQIEIRPTIGENGNVETDFAGLVGTVLLFIIPCDSANRAGRANRQIRRRTGEVARRRRAAHAQLRGGVFVFATPDIEQARQYVATDPVVVQGEMVAECHKFYGSAGMMMINEIHNKIQKK